MYYSGALELDCANMELSQTDAEVPILYRGPGYIRQDDTGQIAFKIFPTDTQNHPSPAAFGQGGTAGKLIGAEDYFTLTAIDALGRRWCADKIRPDSDHGVNGLISVSGSIYVLASIQELPYSVEHHVLHIFDDIHYPSSDAYRMYNSTTQGISLCAVSNDIEKIRSADFAISIIKGDGGVRINLNAAQAFPAQIETRVVEAFQFVLARSLWCRAVESSTGNQKTIKLVSPRPSSVRTRLLPPIFLNTVAGYQNFWHLFDLYLRYILRRSEPGWHTCSVHLHAACEASANSIEAYALGLAVAVEGITNALFPHCAKIDKDHSDSVEAMFEYVELLFARIAVSFSGDYLEKLKGLHERIAGFRGQLLEVRAVDRMHQLARKGMLDKHHITAWKKLRNTSAHAGTPGAPVNQKLVDNIHSTIMLMYMLVFGAIEYKGRYIDYSTHGFPPRAYPSREIAPDV